MSVYRQVVACVAVCLACVVACTASAPAEEPVSPVAQFSLTGNPLVVPGAEPLVGGQQAAAEAARRSSPEAVVARETSSSAYEGLSAAAAEKVAGGVFPGLLDDPAGGLPTLAGGAKVTRFPTQFAASLALPGGRHGVIESPLPIAVDTAGGRAPVDLSLREGGGGFQPVRPVVSVRIPARLSEGARLTGSGLSLTPVDAQGATLEGARGASDGVSVFYGDSEDAKAGVVDVDTLLKPDTLGFSEETLLRAQRSPQKLFFKVGLPQGAHLAQAGGGSGAVQVLDAGQTIAAIPRATATDAEGTPVPLLMSLSGGNTIVLDVPHRAGEYRLPISVDPTVEEKKIYVKSSGPRNWVFESGNPEAFGLLEGCSSEEECSATIDDNIVWNGLKYVYGSYIAGQAVRLVYPTQKDSRIYEFIGTMRVAEADARENGRTEGSVSIQSNEGTVEKGAEIGLPSPEQAKGEEYEKNTPMCLEAGCAPGSVATSHENVVVLKAVATESGNKYFGYEMKRGWTIGILQESGPSVTTDTTDETIGSTPNGFYPGKWVSAGKAKVGVVATDPGIGIGADAISSPQASGWGHGFSAVAGCEGVQCNECWNWSSKCEAGDSTSNEPLTASLAGLPDGKDTVEVKVENDTGESAGVSGPVDVDSTPPHGITLSGLPSGNQVGEGTYHLVAKATDGEGSTESSGMASFTFSLDGSELSKQAKVCSPGPCSASAEWSITGGELSAGVNQLTVTATDNAGNSTSETYAVTVHHGPPLGAGPGSVNSGSGEFSLAATDVSLGGGLSVSRSYGSRHLSAGAGGPLGAQWSMSLAAAENLIKQPNGSIVLNGTSGGQVTFAANGSGGFNSPVGDSNLKLSSTPCETGGSEYMLKNEAANTTTCFRTPTGGNGVIWTPGIAKGVVTTDTVTYAYETVEQSGKQITRPTEALAPVPAGVSCSPELKEGCRALTFNYASATSAKGEAPAEWGEYQGQLSSVTFTAYDSSTGKMHAVAVAQYAYDKQGRLRAEWDPRISPALKTTYGYDAEGHVTAVSPPGQQPWLLNYGTIAGDSSTGRLLSVIRSGAATALGSGLAPVNTTAPALSSVEAAPEVTLSVSNGTWSNAPLAYGYQWQACNSAGAECKAILGATNQTYTPSEGQLGNTLRAEVRALSGGGAVGSSSAASKVVVSALAPTYLSKFGSNGTGNGQFKSSATKGMWDAVDGAGNLWVTDPGNDRVQEFSAAGEYLRQFGSLGSGNGQLKTPQGIAIDSSGNVWVVDQGNDRVEEFSSTGTYIRQFGSGGTGNGQFKSPTGIAINSSGYVLVVDTGNNRVQIFSNSGEYKSKLGSAGKELGQFSGPRGIAVEGSNAWVVDTGNDRLQEIIGSGYEYFAYGQFGSAGSGNGKFDFPSGIAIDANKRIWISEFASARVQEFSSNTNHAYLTQLGSYGSGNGQFESPEGIVLDAKSEHMWVADGETDRMQEFAVASIYTGTPAPPALGSSAVTTIEYRVPVAGNELPELLGGPPKWGETDIPVEGTAIFPPDEPQAWPASNYKRASIYYVDGIDRLVNVATPGGGIATTEYNSNNDVTRTLSPDNRAAALKEGSKSAEVSKLLDTQSKYNGEGTELTETLGPRHLVKLSNGKEVQARSHTVYSYDEGAPAEGGPYRLVTKTTQGAQVEGEAEQDVRTTTTSYSGQGNLGWKLRKPTSVTAEPSGLKLTHTTVYEEATGNAIETRMPKSPGAESPHDTRTIYYDSVLAKELGSTTCAEKPRYANLVCMTLPSKQPETPGLPRLPVTTVLWYNMWGEPTVSEVEGSKLHGTTNVYDGAGRLLSSATSGETGKELPEVTDKYEEKTGALAEQSTTVAGKTQSLKSVFNTLGQLTSYTDADGNSSTYEYETEGAARLKKVNDGKGSQTYAYSETTGLVSELTDSAAGKFVPSYDVEGNLTSESYPNGMAATYTYDPAGETTSLVYKKETYCSEKCEWFKDSVVPTIHGQWAMQTSSLGKEAYVYDGSGRLTESQTTPTGKGCVTRRYAYDEDSNRTSLTTYEPNSKSECATEHGTVEAHTYDSADRLTDTGTTYDSVGNTTTLPAADAGKYALTSSFYMDNQLASQEQNGQTIGYNLDPAHRTREIVSTGKVVATEILHYAGPGSTPAWTSELSGDWTRNIGGLSGLAAIQHNGETPVLQLTNLHGDIVATATDSETATGLASTIGEASDYGVPSSEAPPKYSWLGAHELPTELPSGVAAMGARSYVPELGRFLQSDPIPGGSANAYGYTNGDPLNESDPTGMYDATLSATLVQALDREDGEAAAAGEALIEAEAAAREEAERVAAEAAAQAKAYDDAWLEGAWGGEEYEEYEEYEEEGEEEYAAFDVGPGVKVRSHGPQPTQTAEGGVFFQELSGRDDTGQLTGEKIIAIRHCLTASGKPRSTERYAACLMSVGFLGNLISGAKKFLKNASKTVMRAARKIIGWVQRHASELHEVTCLVQGIGVGTLVGAGATALSDGIGVYAAGTIGGTAGAAVTYACEHE